jgi:cold shock protein
VAEVVFRRGNRKKIIALPNPFHMREKEYSSMAERQHGTVKWFNASKGYGFISSEDGKEYFVHYSEINVSGYRSLKEGQEVEFTAVQGDKGLQAHDVSVAA